MGRRRFSFLFHPFPPSSVVASLAHTTKRGAHHALLSIGGGNFIKAKPQTYRARGRCRRQAGGGDDGAATRRRRSCRRRRGDRGATRHCCIERHCVRLALAEREGERKSGKREKPRCLSESFECEEEEGRTDKVLFCFVFLHLFFPFSLPNKILRGLEPDVSQKRRR